LIANTDSDTIFPLDGVLRVHEQTRRIYKLLGAADNLGLQISPGPHKDTQELQMAAFKFFDKHLRGEERVIDRAATKQFQPEELKVFDKLPADQRNTTIHESFTRRFVAPAALAEGEWKNASAGWQQALTERVLAYWPEEKPADSMPARLVSSSIKGNLRFTRYDVPIHDGLSLPLFQLQDTSLDNEKEALLHVVDEAEWKRYLSLLRGEFAKELAEFGDGDTDEAALKTARRQLQDGPLFFFAPRNIGPTASNPATKPQTQLRRRYMLLGESLEGMQAWDVHRAIAAIRSLSASEGSRTAPLRVRAHGDRAAVALYGMLGRLAKQQEKKSPLPTLELVSPPASHRTGAPFFHVLRYLDLPQAVALATAQSQVELVDVNEDEWRFAIEAANGLGRRDRLKIIAHEAAGQ
jgi:hypothetical protein